MESILLDFEKLWGILQAEVFSWIEVAIKSIPNLISAVLLSLFFWGLAKMVRRVVHNIMIRVTPSVAVRNLMENISYLIVIFIGLFVALGVLNLDKTVTSLIAGAGVIGLALGFAFQEIASNFISGILIAFREPYKVGDIVKIEGYEGEVVEVALRSTTIHTYDGLHVLIPNKDMFTKPIVNFTSTPDRKLELEVGVSYGDNLREVEKIVLSALSNISLRSPNKEPLVFFKGFGDSSINFLAHVWVRPADNLAYLKSRHEAVILIKEAFDNEGITIPFPIRTLDFGIKGGEKLDVPLKNTFGPPKA